MSCRCISIAVVWSLIAGLHVQSLSNVGGGVSTGFPIGLEGGMGVQVGGRMHLLTVITGQALLLDRFGARLGLRTGLAIHL